METPAPNLNVRGTGTLVLDVRSSWTVTCAGISLIIEGLGVLVGIHNFQQSAFGRFEQNQRLRYSAVAKQQDIAVTESEVSLGVWVGVRWLARHPDGYSGHY